jgi:anti-anti-sigma factor
MPGRQVVVTEVCMESSHRYIDVERDGDVHCISFRDHNMDEPSIRAMSDEVETMILKDGCRKLVISLGPLRCLYSVLIARLIKVRQAMAAQAGRLKLCDVTPESMNVFIQCQLQDYFEFTKDRASAIAALKKE